MIDPREEAQATIERVMRSIYPFMFRYGDYEDVPFEDLRRPRNSHLKELCRAAAIAALDAAAMSDAEPANAPLSPPPASGWQSMATAPRDGSAILVWDERCAIPETVCWLDGSKIATPGWYPYAGGNWFVAHDSDRALIWAPIPVPTRAAADTQLAPKRYRHVKRGTTYTEVGRGRLQVGWTYSLPDMTEMVVYQGEKDGALWVRPATEFDDGRFERLAADDGGGK